MRSPGWPQGLAPLGPCRCPHEVRGLPEDKASAEILSLQASTFYYAVAGLGIIAAGIWELQKSKRGR